MFSLVFSQMPYWIVLALTLFACTRQEKSSAEGPAQTLAERGRIIYQGSCTACHNSDPKKDGALGPAVFGSSLELLEARVMRGEYPAGYKPKRDSKVMVPLPQLKKDLPALREYLTQN